VLKEVVGISFNKKIGNEKLLLPLIKKR